jgi:hypothetical protein
MAFGMSSYEGVLKKITPAGHEHGRIAAIVTASLVQHVIANKLGAVYAAETGFKLRSSGKEPSQAVFRSSL